MRKLLLLLIPAFLFASPRAMYLRHQGQTQEGFVFWSVTSEVLWLTNQESQGLGEYYSPKYVKCAKDLRPRIVRMNITTNPSWPWQLKESEDEIWEHYGEIVETFRNFPSKPIVIWLLKIRDHFGLSNSDFWNNLTDGSVQPTVDSASTIALNWIEQGYPFGVRAFLVGNEPPRVSSVVQRPLSDSIRALLDSVKSKADADGMPDVQLSVGYSAYEGLWERDSGIADLGPWVFASIHKYSGWKLNGSQPANPDDWDSLVIRIHDWSYTGAHNPTEIREIATYDPIVVVDECNTYASWVTDSTEVCNDENNAFTANDTKEYRRFNEEYMRYANSQGIDYLLEFQFGRTDYVFISSHWVKCDGRFYLASDYRAFDLITMEEGWLPEDSVSRKPWRCPEVKPRYYYYRQALRAFSYPWWQFWRWW